MPFMFSRGTKICGVTTLNAIQSLPSPSSFTGSSHCHHMYTKRSLWWLYGLLIRLSKGLVSNSITFRPKGTGILTHAESSFRSPYKSHVLLASSFTNTLRSCSSRTQKKRRPSRWRHVLVCRPFANRSP